MSVMHTTIDAAKKHPYWLVGGVLIVIVLFQLKGSGKSAAPEGGQGITTLEEDPNQIAANTALQEAQTAANVQVTEANDAVAMNAANDSAQLQALNTEGTIYGNYFNTAASVQNNAIAASQEESDRSTNAESALATLGLQTNAVLTSQAAYLNAGEENQQLQYGAIANVQKIAQEQADTDAAYTGGAYQSNTFGATLQALEGDLTYGQGAGATTADLTGGNVASQGNAVVNAYGTNTAAMLQSIFGKVAA